MNDVCVSCCLSAWLHMISRRISSIVYPDPYRLAIDILSYGPGISEIENLGIYFRIVCVVILPCLWRCMTFGSFARTLRDSKRRILG